MKLPPQKNTDDEWASKTEWHRVCVFRPRLAEYVATMIKKGSRVLVEGSLVSTTYERGNGKGKKAKTNKQTFLPGASCLALKNYF